jgi:amphi-Trp domain-containing protein
MASSEFKHETLQDVDAISEYLKILTDGFENKELIFRNDREQILLKPDGMIELEVKAKKKDGKVKLAIKFNWKEREPGKDEEEKLVINSKL